MKRKAKKLKIPKSLLKWRESLPKGYVMRRSTFEKIIRDAKKKGYKDPESVAGKAYWTTAKKKFKLAEKRKRGLTKNRCNPKRKLKRNPINKPVVIYDKLLGIEARKGYGKFAGENFKHDFKDKTDAMVLGNPDGSLTIKSKKGKRLWKNFNY